MNNVMKASLSIVGVCNPNKLLLHIGDFPSFTPYYYDWREQEEKEMKQATGKNEKE